jgi:hypothetical protein
VVRLEDALGTALRARRQTPEEQRLFAPESMGAYALRRPRDEAGIGALSWLSPGR